MFRYEPAGARLLRVRDAADLDRERFVPISLTTLTKVEGQWEFRIPGAEGDQDETGSGDLILVVKQVGGRCERYQVRLEKWHFWKFPWSSTDTNASSCRLHFFNWWAIQYPTPGSDCLYAHHSGHCFQASSSSLSRRHISSLLVLLLCPATKCYSALEGALAGSSSSKAMPISSAFIFSVVQVVRTRVVVKPTSINAFKRCKLVTSKKASASTIVYHRFALVCFVSGGK